MDAQPDIELRQHLIGQLQHCPIPQCNPEDCLLFPVVKMKTSDRVRWLNALSLESLRLLASYHYFCSLSPSASHRSD
jgi:hypothetical protein